MEKPKWPVKRYANGTLIGDPSNIIRDREVYREFCDKVAGSSEPRNKWLLFTFRGVNGKIYFTPQEGLYFGVPVDTGMIIKVRETDLPFERIKPEEIPEIARYDSEKDSDSSWRCFRQA
jgi:hypothetical protein